MKRHWLLIVVAMALLCLALTSSALAGQKEDAKALVEAAVAMVKAKGLDATMAAVKDKKGPFVKGNLYIFAGSTEKVELVAHPINPALVGKNMGKMKDVKGKYFFVEFMNTAKSPGKGWVSYWWPKPGEKKPSLKDTYVMKVPDHPVWFACGYYK
jgi:signal transduction histidine kinase